MRASRVYQNSLGRAGEVGVLDAPTYNAATQRMLGHVGTIGRQERFARALTFYHDVEQDFDSAADPEACRRMVQEFLKLESRYRVPVTYNVVGRLQEQQPDLVRWIRDAGAEVAAHSYSHPRDWQPAYYASQVAQCGSMAPRAKGYRSPQSRWDQSTLESAWRHGFLWNAELDRTPQPYFINKGLVRLPIAGDDWPVHTHARSVEQWVERFQEHLRTRAYFGIGSHDCVAALAPERMLNAWERLLQIAASHDALTITFSEAADLFRRNRLARHYERIAANWNRATRRLYRTRRFQELIRREAEATAPRPVIADLGSAGGALTLPLLDIAGKLYCVDQTPGMVAELGDGVETIIGEVTATPLPDDSVDVIVCARLIEYLFWPERLADEIRRIGRAGATVIATFPAVCDSMAPQEGAPPDRIRHYFAPEEILSWAEPIGPGRLLGVQHDPAEPRDAQEEHRYRLREENPSGDVRPTNWVWIGRVVGRAPDRSYRPAIPLSAFDFPDEAPAG
jgi:peptidoglycan/xylan/chitin deacetylase (PgdA/CDA1 family)/ubiquinone/menaquinone biosynthesis C-methylase UbiE